MHRQIRPSVTENPRDATLVETKGYSRRTNTRAGKPGLGLIEDGVQKLRLFWARHDEHGAVAVREDGDAVVSGCNED